MGRTEKCINCMWIAKRDHPPDLLLDVFPAENGS